MAITQTQSAALLDAPQVANGSFLDDAASPAAISITLGFTPKYVRVVNQTTRVMYEWFEGMTAAHALKTVAAGTRTAETSGGITVTSKGFSAPAPAQNDQIRWQAFA